MKRFAAMLWVLVLVGLFVWPAGAQIAVPPPKNLPTLEEEEQIVMAEEPPAVPPGYNSRNEVMLAIFSGKLDVLNPEMNIEIPENVTVETDVEYGKVDDRSLVLDLYCPKDLDKAVPGLLLIHGGGWSKGNKDDLKYYAVRFAKRGYVVASVGYRLIGEAVFPACVQDVKCAARWMRANAERLHVDPDRIIAIGGSAGGHLSMMLGYSDSPELEGAGGHADQSSAVQGVVNLYGPTDLTVPGDRDHPLVVAFFGGKKYEEVPEQYKLASPIHHLDKNDPPTLTIHGTIDELVPIAQADMLVERLKELGIPCPYDRIEGFPHSLDLAVQLNLRCQWQVMRFLEKYFADKN